MKKTALIMAGGRGERFWPRSRKNLPKQFLSLTDDGRTMIQLTVARILPLVNMEDIFIVTSSDYMNIVREQLPEIPIENIICEPVGKNTAPCIGVGATYIAHKYKDAIMIVLPADHLIKFTNIFISTLNDACELAEKNTNLVTIGITPDYPETGYGYIKFNSNFSDGRAYLVEKFVEKPNLETAKEYIASEEYMWNSGMFIWKVSSILSNIELYIPKLFQGLNRIAISINLSEDKQVLEKEFMLFEPQSIDYGIMEKAKDIYVLAGAFGWDDVGSWLSIERIKKSDEYGNVVNGNIITIDTYNSIIQGEQKLIATVGLDNVIIVDTDDATLVCSKDNAGKIKKVIENLKICNRNEYI